MSRLVIMTAIGALSLAACDHWPVKEADPTRDPGSNVGRMQAADARSSAQQRCGAFGAIQRAGTDGTAPADYDCERPSK